MLRHLRFYANDQLVTEIDSFSQRVYFRCNSLPIATVTATSSGKTLALLGTDRQHTVLIEKTLQGRLFKTYTPYGLCASTEQNLLAFNGERQEHTGHYILGNGYRSFNTTLMRFEKPDSYSPMGMGGINAFTYGLGDPVGHHDPSGHFSAAVMKSLKEWSARAKLRTMFAKAPEANIYLDDAAQQLGKIYGASWVPAPQKTWARAWEKTQQKYAGDPTLLKDIVRNALVAKKRTAPQIVKAIEALGGKYKYIDASTDPLGYSGINAIIPTPNGLWGEIQVIPKRMSYARFSPELSPTSMSKRSFDRINNHAESLGLSAGVGHKYYRIFREANASIRDKAEAAKLSKAYYGALVKPTPV
ncbi:RHS repeat-associated core domain-containing protein [Pseudomonas sp. SGAir0191]|uniref:RHS repeat-associated core domain-containing protein n=1 Tax=Pseudomonas sp. SGAir0191 TaxID=2217867 RepID=UPI000C2C420A|nr:RHS repeat-associated core domain-containing protein [Pseudomonas sp. SGAir0191]AUA34444.1 RHS repeat-associated core domain-containing protein [Pseudomonas sp. SGAir0191]